MERESKLCHAEVCINSCTAVCYNPSLVLVKPGALSVHAKARSHNAAPTLQGGWLGQIEGH